MTPEDIALYRRAILLWGEEPQMRMAQEECAELIVAIAHVLRRRYPLTTLAVAEEVADMQIMAEQLALLIGPTHVARARAEKLRRLAERVEQSEALESQARGGA